MGSLSQDDQTCNRCRLYRTEQQNHSLLIVENQCTVCRCAIHDFIHSVRSFHIFHLHLSTSELFFRNPLDYKFLY